MRRDALIIVIAVLFFAFLVTSWLAFQNAKAVADDISTGTLTRFDVLPLYTDIATALIIGIIGVLLLTRILRVDRATFLRRVTPAIAGGVYLVVCTVLVPAGRWDWTLALLSVPVTVALAVMRSTTGWFLFIEYLLTVICISADAIRATRFGLGDFLSGEWLVILGAAVVFVAIQLPIYWFVRFLSRNLAGAG